MYIIYHLYYCTINFQIQVPTTPNTIPPQSFNPKALCRQTDIQSRLIREIPFAKEFPRLYKNKYTHLNKINP